ncbi:MAG: hypothetical protein B6I36_03275 [Desulfobacteraceae bacterium 4572_35.1]|nr:MAG: hypothetical protein B6I36_03275 [Desulfobacteraceae bacterium 4572_35.1]
MEAFLFCAGLFLFFCVWQKRSSVSLMKGGGVVESDLGDLALLQRNKSDVINCMAVSNSALDNQTNSGGTDG